MIFLSRKAVSSAGERITSLSGKSTDDIALELRRMMAAGDWADPAEFASDHADMKVLLLPADCRAVNGDRVVVIVVPDQYTPGEEVAVVVKPMRQVRKLPKGPAVCGPERLGSMPKLPTLAELTATEQACAPIADEATELEKADQPAAEPPRVRQIAAKSFGLSRGAAMLQSEILRRGMARPEAAASIGVKDASISRWCRGRDLPRMAHAARIQEVFGIPVGAWVESI
jgi:DNA-binding XRE family transcriptional regulator